MLKDPITVHFEHFTAAEHRKADELFKVFSSAVNSVKDTYCLYFNDLDDRMKYGWLMTARDLLSNWAKV